MVELKIKLKKKQALPFKKHLEKEHPITRGNIMIENCDKSSKKRSKALTTRSQVRAITKSAPNFQKIAAKAVRL